MLDEGLRSTGSFSIRLDRKIHGELTLAGANTSLYLRDHNVITRPDIQEEFIDGVLHDLTRVTLVQCIMLETGFTSRGDEQYNYANVYPHYVTSGTHHINPKERSVTQLRFVVDDAYSLFDDWSAFGRAKDPDRFIEEIVRSGDSQESTLIGPDPQVLYFTGKREIFSADIRCGQIVASHNPRYSLIGSPQGVFIKNRIFINVTLKENATFKEAIDVFSKLLQFLDILAGRPQNIVQLQFITGTINGHPIILDVYQCTSPRRDSRHERKKPHSGDVLIKAARHPSQLATILNAWLERDKEWCDARWRFSSSFAKQQHYDIDRLIGSANMFDILPTSAIRSNVPLSPELCDAKEQCRKIFQTLPSSLERDSVLSALGRVGTCTLKHKIRQRSELLRDTDAESFPDLDLVTDEAVNCRNHYVHGSVPRFDYNKNFDVVIFFTDTLEFVFAASDLIESGWNIDEWARTGNSGTHPFGLLRGSYLVYLERLKTLLGNE